LGQNPDKINWCNLSKNPHANSLLNRFPEKINWETIHENPNPIIKVLGINHDMKIKIK
jgi:ribosomal protein L24E